MKVTTEKLPRSLVALDIELEQDQVEKGLDRAARRLSQKYTVPGFRKGKAPRFIIENYFGRAALLEEATQDLINKALRDALKQEQITPVGHANLESLDPADGFRFRVTVPISPTAILPDYRAIEVPFETEPVTDEMVERTMEMIREKHVMLKELEEPRPVQPGDQVTVKMETIVDGEPMEQREDGAEIPETTIVFEPERLVDDLYTGMLGMQIDEERDITAQIPEDHPNEQVQGKEVAFHVQVTGLQERVLPEWDDLPALEEFEGTLDDLRASTRENMEQSARASAERQVIDTYIEELVEQTEYDLPDVLIQEVAEELLENQAQQFARYGITLDQMLTYRGQTREEAIEDLLPDAEQQLKVRLALQQLIGNEELSISDQEIESEINQIVQDYSEEERGNVLQTLSDQLRLSVANVVLDRKLRARLIEIATGEAPALPDTEAVGDTETTDTPAVPAEAPATVAMEAAAAAETEPPATETTSSPASEEQAPDTETAGETRAETQP